VSAPAYVSQNVSTESSKILNHTDCCAARLPAASAEPASPPGRLPRILQLFSRECSCSTNNSRVSVVVLRTTFYVLRTTTLTREKSHVTNFFVTCHEFFRLATVTLAACFVYLFVEPLHSRGVFWRIRVSVRTCVHARARPYATASAHRHLRFTTAKIPRAPRYVAHSRGGSWG